MKNRTTPIVSTIRLCIPLMCLAALIAPKGAAVETGANPVPQNQEAVASAAGKPMDNEREAIRQVLLLYIDVTDKGKRENIRKALHPEARFMSVGKHGLTQLTLDEWWGRISGIAGKTQRKGEITVLDVSGLAAAAKVDFGRSQDYMTLLKINGEWKIVNKILSTSL
jgi:protease I